MSKTDEIWRVLLELKEDVGVVKGDVKEVKTMTEYQENHLRNLNGQMEKQGMRISGCEMRITTIETKRKMEKQDTGNKILPDRLAWLARGWTGAILIMAAIIAIIYNVGAAFSWW